MHTLTHFPSPKHNSSAHTYTSHASTHTNTYKHTHAHTHSHLQHTRDMISLARTSLHEMWNINRFSCKCKCTHIYTTEYIIHTTWFSDQVLTHIDILQNQTKWGLLFLVGQRKHSLPVDLVSRGICALCSYYTFSHSLSADLVPCMCFVIMCLVLFSFPLLVRDIVLLCLLALIFPYLTLSIRWFGVARYCLLWYTVALLWCVLFSYNVLIFILNSLLFFLLLFFFLIRCAFFFSLLCLLITCFIY